VIHNPAQQLLYIKKGFWESGVNVLRGSQSSGPLENEQDIALPLLLFLNGEALHSVIRGDVMAYTEILDLLKKMTSLVPENRLLAKEVLLALDRIDDLLLLGTGVD
jgi:hypothetical protein